MSLYMATICKDGDGAQVVVHWDDNDPNRFIYSPILVDHPVADEAELASLLGSQGWRIVSKDSDNVGRGFAVVARRGPNGEAYHPHPFYNPLTRDWLTYLSDDNKRAIIAKWPDAKVPGTSVRGSDTGWVPFS